MTGRKGPSEGRTDILTQLLDYTVQTFVPQVYSLDYVGRLTCNFSLQYSYIIQQTCNKNIILKLIR